MRRCSMKPYIILLLLCLLLTGCTQTAPAVLPEEIPEPMEAAQDGMHEVAVPYGFDTMEERSEATRQSQAPASVDCHASSGGSQ